jgi:hypothetical protein
MIPVAAAAGGADRVSFLSFHTVYPDGNVCISILHTPGEDPLMYEQASERWSPVQSVEKVLLSVISMLAGMFVVVLNPHPFLYRSERSVM